MTTRRTSLDPEAVLRGRTSPDAASLCALIRSVNPTGLDLPAPERAHRYKQKSRLQSVLVRRFQDEIDVVRDGADGSEIVLLRHRPTGSSAGHAPVADLDEDARSWVRRTLDMQSAPRAPEPRPSSPGAPGTTVRFRERPSAPGESAGVPALIRAGKRAAAAYDYDLARRLFARALEATGGAPSPARLLVGLLVDELGADTEALALAESLDEEAAADPEVCARLSVAAARLGERTRARALARGLRDDVLARVLVCLGTSAVASGDLETAAHDLHEAKRADPSHLEIAALEAALERAMAARVEPLIERVFALLDAGRIDEAESAVRELRTAQAMAPRAREAILALEERRRAMRVAELVAEADRALERGLPEKAVGLLRQALLERPADAEDTERRLAEAERAHRDAVDGAGAAEIEARGLGRAVITGEAVPMPDAWSMGIQGMCETARLLRRRGSELIDVFARGRLLLIRVIDVTQVPHRIRALAALRLPQPFTLHTAEISGDALLATSWYGGILQVSLDGFRVRAYRPGRYDLVERAHEPLLALPRTFDNATVADDGRTVWILDKKYSRLRGVDVESMRTVHEERGEGVDWRVECSSGVAGSAFLFVNGTDAAELRTADGKRIPGGRFPVDLILSSSTAFPGGGVFVVTKKGEGHGARAVRLRPGEPPAPLLDLGPIPDGAFYCAATDRPSSRIFLLFEMVESAAPHRVLLALDARDGALHVLYRVEVPCRTLLVQDADTRIPSIVLVERGALRVLPLGESPPPLPALPDLLSHVTLPGIALYGATCQTMSKERSAEVERWKQMARASLDGHHSLSKAALDRNDPVELLDLGRALKAVVGNQVGRALEARAMLDHPDHPIVRWWRGYMEAANGSWENARDILQGIDPAPLDPGSARHFAHMLGLALLHAGEHDEAYRVLSRGAEHPGACALNGLLLIASPPGEEVVRDPADRPLCELLRLIAAADERLAEGDPERAAAILDDVLVWEVAEVQSLARLTRALLDVRSSAGADRRYRMLFALSHFLSAHETRSTDRNELFLRGRWLTPALDALAAEAQAWIDQELGG